MRELRSASVLIVLLVSTAACKKKQPVFTGPGTFTIAEVNLTMTLPAGATATYLTIPGPNGEKPSPTVSLLLDDGYMPLVDIGPPGPTSRVDEQRQLFERQTAFQKKKNAPPVWLDKVLDAPDAFIDHHAGQGDRPYCEASACEMVGDRRVCISASAGQAS